MSTFLELCQDVARESGVVSGTKPSKVTTQSGQLLSIVEWTAQAWVLIQNLRPDWRWMQGTYSSTTTASTGAYTPAAFSITDLRKWAEDLPDEDYYPHTEYLTATGVSVESHLRQISYKAYRTRYLRGTQTNNIPAEYAISPANELLLGPIPDAIYTIQGEYSKSATRLTANGDTPAMPSHFHELIVWRAIMLAAGYDEAVLQLGDAQRKYEEILFSLEQDQLPSLRLGGGALA